MGRVTNTRTKPCRHTKPAGKALLDMGLAPFIDHRPRMQKACHASSGRHTISITSPAPLGPASPPGAPPESPVRRSFSLLPRGPFCAAVRPTPGCSPPSSRKLPPAPSTQAAACLPRSSGASPFMAQPPAAPPCCCSGAGDAASPRGAARRFLAPFLASTARGPALSRSARRGQQGERGVSA